MFTRRYLAQDFTAEPLGSWSLSQENAHIGLLLCVQLSQGRLARMGDARDLCPHLDCIGEVTKEDLLLKSKGTCQSCGVAGPNLWACLQVKNPHIPGWA